MPIPNYLKKVVDQQEAIVISLPDPDIAWVAKHIAFYAAMVNAAEDDPLGDETEQNDTLEYLNGRMTEWVEQYQTLVNEKL